MLQAVTLELGRADAERVSFPDLAMLTFSLTARELAFTAEGVFVEGIGLVDAPCRALLTAEAAITARMFKHEQWLAAILRRPPCATSASGSSRATT
ncbi:hypothetical protein [Caulobacter zeae]|uniref:hypothetical protein n=1 Tax=Caulobacter zeae TaxID=2055137 RepID=UPI001056B1DC|nr:hypothetical protein [Caulobacter zeae]